MAIPQSTVSTPTPSVGGLPTPPVDYNQGRDIARENQKLKDMSIDPNAAARMNQKTLLEATYTPQELANIPYYGYVAQRDKFKEQTGKNLAPGGSTPEPTASVLRPLEQALRVKQEIGNQPLGEADAFKMAGLDPYINLSQSLKQHSQDIDYKYNSFANVVGRVGEGLRDTYNVALDGYKTASDEYNTEIERMNKIVEKQMDFEQAMKQIEVQHQNAKSLAEWTQKMQQKYTENKQFVPESDYQDAGVFDQVTGDFTPLYIGGGKPTEAPVEFKDGGGRPTRAQPMFADAFQKAEADYFAATGKHIYVGSDYRSTEQQQAIRDKLGYTSNSQPSGYNGLPKAAPPGSSFHNNGLAVDIDENRTNLDEVAPYLAKYGIIGNTLAGDKHHFSMGEMNPDIFKGEAGGGLDQAVVDKYVKAINDGKSTLDKAQEDIKGSTTIPKNQKKAYKQALYDALISGGSEGLTAEVIEKYLPARVADLDAEGVKFTYLARDAEFLVGVAEAIKGMPTDVAIERIKQIVEQNKGGNIDDKGAKVILSLLPKKSAKQA